MEGNQSLPCSVSCFVDAVRDFVALLQDEPGQAVWDAHGDFFVGMSQLFYDDEFRKELAECRADDERIIHVLEDPHVWLAAVCTLFGAIANYAEEWREKREADRKAMGRGLRVVRPEE